ncbi:exocyst complex component EXO84B-like [Camellia sinensis]|uniref:exocyst complex component EXO84B-like n=2 Tax=Camellia sinensis TaxID=4442 RepID=UPI001035E060|nr:exocyst complex component EXO84B-like [Camellia sinensis]
MASAKSSRSRILNNTAAKSNNPKDSGNKLQENLNVFKSDNFDADGFVQSKCNSLNEKLSFSDRLSGHLVVQAEIFNSQLLAVLQAGLLER